MSETTHLWLFFGLVFGVIVLPGMDMAFVLGSALVGGRRAGLSAVAGLMAGAACHVAMGATGVAVALAVLPSAFNVMLLAGALYVAFLGYGLWRTPDGLALEAPPALRSAPRTFARAAATNLLNPKAYVFMLAVFPQFVRPEYGPIAVQALVLGAITVATQLVVYGTVAWLADGARDWLREHPGRLRAVARSVGALLVVVAVVTVLEGWRPSPPPAVSARAPLQRR
jgi:threonine/homoserine/homoserine lactone efflux protein